jgi:hypothetical protein
VTSWEMWTCDWHDSDRTEGSATNEDEARDTGWKKYERREFRETVFPAIEGIRVEELVLPARWHTDERHVCAGCLEDPECVTWLEGWTDASA